MSATAHWQCCCDEATQPDPPEQPGDPPTRNPTDPTGSAGCACFMQYSSMLVTVAGLVNCSPQRRLYNCSPGSPVIARFVITSLPQGTWSVPITYNPADSQVGYTNEDVILTTIPAAIEVRSTNDAVYSAGPIRLRLVYGRVRACNDKRLEALVRVEAGELIVQNQNAFDNQRPDFGTNCADPNGAPDGRTSFASFAEFAVDCTVLCVAPLTCTAVRLPATCPDPAETMDGTLIAGGTATLTAV